MKILFYTSKNWIHIPDADNVEVGKVLLFLVQTFTATSKVCLNRSPLLEEIAMSSDRKWRWWGWVWGWQWWWYEQGGQVLDGNDVVGVMTEKLWNKLIEATPKESVTTRVVEGTKGLEERLKAKGKCKELIVWETICDIQALSSKQNRFWKKIEQVIDGENANNWLYEKLGFGCYFT